jgi:hypothetical protein
VNCITLPARRGKSVDSSRRTGQAEGGGYPIVRLACRSKKIGDCSLDWVLQPNNRGTINAYQNTCCAWNECGKHGTGHPSWW